MCRRPDIVCKLELINIFNTVTPQNLEKIVTGLKIRLSDHFPSNFEAIFSLSTSLPSPSSLWHPSPF